MSTLLTGGAAPAAGSGGDGGSAAGTGVGGGVPDGGGSGGAGAPAGGASGGAAGTGVPPTATWRDALPEELKGHQALSSISDVQTLAQSYLHAQSLVGKKGVIPPNEKSSDQEWDAFYTALGRPAVDKYEIKAPQGFEVDEATMKELKEISFKTGLLPKQAQALLEWNTRREAKADAAVETEISAESAQQLQALKLEWGQGYDVNVQRAVLAVKEIGGKDFSDYLAESGLGNDVKLIKFMAQVGKLLPEHKLAGDGSGRMGKTPKEVQSEIDKVMGDPKHPYFDKSHQGHTAAVKHMSTLWQQLAPAEKTG